MTQCFIVSNLKAPTVQLRQDARCPHESTVPVDDSWHVTVRDRSCPVSVLIWAIPALGTIGESLGVDISDRGSGGPRDNRIWVVAGRETTRFRQERKELQRGQYLRNRHWKEDRLRLTENLENKAEEPGSTEGSRKSQKFVFPFLTTPLSVNIKLYAKAINLAVACHGFKVSRDDRGSVRTSC